MKAIHRGQNVIRIESEKAEGPVQLVPGTFGFGSRGIPDAQELLDRAEMIGNVRRACDRLDRRFFVPFRFGGHHMMHP